MPTQTVTTGFDAWTDQAKPAKNFGTDWLMRLQASGGGKGAQGYIFLRCPVPRGAKVTSAILRFTVRGASSGSRTIRAARAARAWKQRQITWNNKPATVGGQASVNVGALKQGNKVDLNVTSQIQTIANGAANNGFVIWSSGSARHTFFGVGSAHPPQLIVTWTTTPAKPAVPTPPSGSVIGTPKPTLGFDFYDPTGNGIIAAQVEIYGEDQETLVLDSGEYATNVAEFPMEDFGYSIPEGVMHYWRVRVKGEDGEWSEWSDLTSIYRESKPQVLITAPGTDELVYDGTPTIEWTTEHRLDDNGEIIGPWGGEQAAWQVLVYNAATQRLEYDSGRQPGTDTSHEVATALPDDQAHVVEVRAWDGNTNRVTSPGDTAYGYAQRQFSVDDDLSQPPVDTLTAEPEADTPWVRLTWTRALGAPDAFHIFRDGHRVRTVEATDVEVEGEANTWSTLEYTATPLHPTTYTVKAVTNGAQSAPSPDATIRVTKTGLFLVDTDTGDFVALLGDDEGTWGAEDEANVYQAIGSDFPVRIVSGMPGYDGDITGLLVDDDPDVIDDQVSILYAMKTNVTKTLRLVAGDVNIPVIIGDLVITPSPLTNATQIYETVTFHFWQSGELPYTFTV